jgi:hypothetical protein
LESLLSFQGLNQLFDPLRVFDVLEGHYHLPFVQEGNVAEDLQVASTRSTVDPESSEAWKTEHSGREENASA